MRSQTTQDASNPDTDPDAALVSVVIPCRNEEAAIEACLVSVLVQDCPNLQVLVVDGCSEDATRDIVQRVMTQDPRVELLDNPDRMVPAAMNVGLAAARGAWLVRVDAHAAIPGDYVTRVVAHLGSGLWGGVGGCKVGRGETPQGRAIAAAMSSRFGVGGSRYHYATRVMEVDHIPFGSYPTALARAVGGWDESLAINQDFEFDLRLRMAGHRLLLDPSLVIDWESRQHLVDLLAQYRRYGSGKVDVIAKHPSSALPRHLAPPAVVALLATSLLVGLSRPRLGLLGAVPYLAFLGAGTRDVRAMLEDDPSARLFAGPALAAMHLAWGTGFLQGTGRRVWCALIGQDPTMAAARRRRAGARPAPTARCAR